MIARRVATSLLFLFLIVSCVFCEERTRRPTVVVATDPTYPPFEFHDDDGELVGFDIDVIRAVSEASDFELDLVVVSFSYVFDRLLEGEVDAVISGVTITTRRSEAMSFSRPYHSEPQLLLVPASSPAVRGLSDLSGSTVGVLQGSATSERLRAESAESGYAVVDFDSALLAMRTMMAGDLDAVVVDATYADLWSEDPQWGYVGEFRTVAEPVSREDLGIVVSADRPDLLSLVNEGLASLVESGRLNEIRSIWFGDAH